MPKMQSLSMPVALPRNFAEEARALIFEFDNGWSVLAEPCSRTGLTFFVWVKHPKLIDRKSGDPEYYWDDLTGTNMAVGDQELLAFLLQFALAPKPRKKLVPRLVGEEGHRWFRRPGFLQGEQK